MIGTLVIRSEPLQFPDLQLDDGFLGLNWEFTSVG